MTAVATPRFAAADYRPTFLRVLNAEWIKFRSLRSSGWTVALTIAIMAGFAALAAFVVVLEGATEGPQRPMFLVIGYPFAQLTIGVLGALIITGEYGTGAIRSTFTAEPRRVRVIAAKALLVALVAAVVSAVAIALATAAGLGIYASGGIDEASTAGELFTLAASVVAYLTMSALFAYGVALLVRHSAAAITLVVGVFFVAPIVMQVVASLTGAEWAWTVYNYLPSIAGSQMMEGLEMGYAPSALSAGAGAAVLGGYTAALLVAGTVVSARRED